MKAVTVDAVILGHKRFGEGDKLIFLYSDEFGKIKVIAKGASKVASKFTGHLETMNFCQAALYFGPRNIILTEIVTIKNFTKLREDFDRSKSALFMAEMTNKLLLEGQQLNDLSGLIERSLRHLLVTKNPSLVSYSYLMKIMDGLGLMPDFKQVGDWVDGKYLKFLQFIKTGELPEIEKISLSCNEDQEIEKIFDRMLAYVS